MKRTVINVGLLLFSLGICVLLFEIVLRIANVSFPIFTVVDEHTGWRLRAGAEGWHTGEGTIYIRINNHGLRNRNTTYQKPEGTLRIAVLGDSFAEARQVEMDSTFSTVAESELAQCTTKETQHIEVMNFGVSGFGTAQEYLLLQEYVWQFDPDIIVLAFFSGNDVRNNSKQLSNDPNSPYFIYNDDGTLQRDLSFRSSPLYTSQTRLSHKLLGAAINKSRTLQVLNRVRNVLRQQEHQEEPREEPEQHIAGLDTTGIYTTPSTDAWEEAWNITEDILLLMADAVRNREKEFLLLSIGTEVQTSPDTSKRKQLAATLNIKDVTYPEERLEGLSQTHNIHFLNLAKVLQEFAVDNGTHLHGHFATDPNYVGGHWNENGHRVAGQAIARYICNELLQ